MRQPVFQYTSENFVHFFVLAFVGDVLSIDRVKARKCLHQGIELWPTLENDSPANQVRRLAEALEFLKSGAETSIVCLLRPIVCHGAHGRDDQYDYSKKPSHLHLAPFFTTIGEGGAAFKLATGCRAIEPLGVCDWGSSERAASILNSPPGVTIGTCNSHA
ncbi:hypothetical protein FJ987_21150 [Mesorhizobium sp. CU2]|uniref:hypothetical protein n=1 Tax=unclassified Mesorhizobium TaxID=325217 RepID=UPI0011293774|nr:MULTISPECIES: hypothetical protein [unclassified Mesorhizobium]TPN88339.1 hypothetical protein FJ988_04645 [Mesorhizobium sp. CU3]TPO10313.1 hypothetical protein FJ987_21150 [Mesorhizobium sp. CU2]